MDRNQHRESRERKKQRNIFQTNQAKTIEKVLNDMDVSDSSDKYFKIVVIGG